MELIFGVVATSGLGYIVGKLERMEEKLNHLEQQILVLSLSVEKRKEIKTRESKHEST